jgi:hypothetical protein
MVMSLAYLPLDTVLLILDELWSTPQIIPIDIIGPITEKPKQRDMESVVSTATKVILRPPPLAATAAATCRLFRFTYQKSRPALWGDHLHLRRSFHVDLQRDIFHVRVRRRVHPYEWDIPWRIHWDPLYNILRGVERVATSANYVDKAINPWVPNFLRHINLGFKELMVLIPTPDLENNALLRIRRMGGPGPHLVDSLLMPMDDSWWVKVPPIPGAAPENTDRSRPFKDLKKVVEKRLRIPVKLFTNWARTLPAHQRQYLRSTWRLATLPKVKGYLVDEKELNDPDAYEFWPPPLAK